MEELYIVTNIDTEEKFVSTLQLVEAGIRSRNWQSYKLTVERVEGAINENLNLERVILHG